MNSWITTTIDDARISGTPMEPILTIERSGDEWGDVIIHKTAEELEQIIRDNSGALGGLARLALEILSLQTYEAELRAALERIAELEAREQRPNPLSQALNEGDGVYRP